MARSDYESCPDPTNSGGMPRWILASPAESRTAWTARRFRNGPRGRGFRSELGDLKLTVYQAMVGSSR
jgi:hypothetical protein